MKSCRKGACLLKTVYLCLLTALLGLAAGILVTIPLTDLPYQQPPPDAAALHVNTNNAIESTEAATIQDTTPTMWQQALLNLSYQVLDACQRQDFSTLSTLAHPIKGITFTPYSTVDEANLTFHPLALSQAQTDERTYLWGLTDGSGQPIQLTISAYFDRYVWDTDYTAAGILGIDRVISSGNSLENVAEAYPDGHFVEFYSLGKNKAYDGTGWSGLKLVFETHLSQYFLVGIIHSEWTI